MGPDLLLIGGLQPPRALVSISNMLCMFEVRYLVVSKLACLLPTPVPSSGSVTAGVHPIKPTHAWE